MKKIISLFQRNYDGDKLVRDEVVPGAEWVIAGEGKATRKWDGTSCLYKGGKLFKRYDAKHGKKPPFDFIQAQEPDPVTGHWPGWVPVNDGSGDTWHREGFKVGMATTGDRAGRYTRMVEFKDGQTYELIGPKVGTNPEKALKHILVEHGACELEAPRTFSSLKEWFKDKDIEGIVWHHPDGRMVKIKKRDFGYSR